VSLTRVLRYTDAEEMAAGVAEHLVQHVVALQDRQPQVHVSLAEGEVAQRAYAHFATLATAAGLDPARLELWWSSERFVPTTDPNRHATQALAVLARTFTLVPGQTHPMPPKEGQADPDEAAFAYATELGTTVFDVCLLDMGADGHVAAIFPEHASMKGQEGSSALAVGVSNAPDQPRERVTLTFQAINRSRQVWVMASGTDRRRSLDRVFSGDPTLPASHVHGVDKTLWFLDLAAAADLPEYRCDL